MWPCGFDGIRTARRSEKQKTQKEKEEEKMEEEKNKEKGEGEEKKEEKKKEKEKGEEEKKKKRRSGEHPRRKHPPGPSAWLSERTSSPCPSRSILGRGTGGRPALHGQR